MGKKWDYDVPSIEMFERMLKVTKPGGTMLCFAGSMTQHRMAVNIEDAGWILKDCIMWLNGVSSPIRESGVKRRSVRIRSPILEGRRSVSTYVRKVKYFVQGMILAPIVESISLSSPYCG